MSKIYEIYAKYLKSVGLFCIYLKIKEKLYFLNNGKRLSEMNTK